MFTCEICGTTFENGKVKSNHIRWYHSKTTFSENGIAKVKENALASNEKRFGKWIEEEVNCHKCGKSKTVYYREGHKKAKYFCSRVCANSHNMEGVHTDEIKKVISDKMKIVWQNPEYIKNQFTNNKFRFNSKREVEIRDYFIKNFPTDGWTFGGHLRLTEDVFVARDLFSDKLKICFEYDGVWHFKNIKGQLQEKQQKDKLLEEWCLENNYRLIRVDSEASVDIKSIEDLIYNNNKSVIKIGKRY
jgi:hypothetical protein